MFYNGKNVLVAGGTGFVGTNFVLALLKEGANVRISVHKRLPIINDSRVEIIEADFNNPDDCRKACRGVQYVFNCAGAVSAARMTVTNPMSAIATNLVVNVRLLEAAMMEGVERILVFSSGTTAYPPFDYPVKEEDMWKGEPADVYFGYGWMRRYIELLGKFAGTKSKMGVAICRPTAVYGRYDDFDLNTGHVVPSLVRRAIERQSPYVVWGTGNEVRDFLHVSDLVRGCLLLLKKYPVSDPVNIGYGTGVTIKELVKIILNATGYSDAQLIFDASKPTTIPVRLVNTEKAKKILNFQPAVSLEDGIEDLVRWYKEQHL